MEARRAIKTCFRKYVTFTGRAERSEFWWFATFCFAGAFGAFWLAELFLPHKMGVLENPAFAALLLFLGITVMPLNAVGWRRLNDSGLKGAVFLFPFGILAAGIASSLAEAYVMRPGREYAGLGGVIVAYAGIVISAPVILLLCLRPSRQPNQHRFSSEVTP